MNLKGLAGAWHITEMDEASGTCYLSLTSKDQVEGEFTFDNGDSSGFQAGRAKKVVKKKKAAKKKKR